MCVCLVLLALSVEFMLKHSRRMLFWYALIHNLIEREHRIQRSIKQAYNKNNSREAEPPRHQNFIPSLSFLQLLYLSLDPLRLFK